MKKNLNIEILRSIALLFVVAYHIQCLMTKQIFNNHYMNIFLNFGGEIGVTMFFIISGFGIYKSVNYKKNKKEFKYSDYIKKRLIRVAVPYYFCLLIGLAVTGSAIYLNFQGLKHILSHITFTHNLFVDTHGSINGALWTMGTFVQFYFIAPLLYKAINDKPFLNLTIIIIITVVFKGIVYSILDAYNFPGTYYFVYGRQVFTALDNFALGMFIAKFDKFKIENLKINCILLFLSFVILTFLVHTASINGLYLNNWFGYIWHSLLAINLAFIFKLIMNFELNSKSIINKSLLIISKYEYEIYLWHFILVSNILGAGFIVAIENISIKCCALFLLLLCIIFGMLISKYQNNE